MNKIWNRRSRIRTFAMNNLNIGYRNAALGFFRSILEPRAKASPALREENENVLEKKIAWLIGSPRSGTSWLGTRLLRHPDNVIWNEPLIYFHLKLPAHRIGIDTQKDAYFLSPRHRESWLPAFKRLILVRAYSEAKTLTKNIIIKEHAGGVADIITECLPNSKLIFLLRDGRDVVASLIDAHRPDSWNKTLSVTPLLTEESRKQAIRNYSQMWTRYTQTTWKAYNNKTPDLRLLLKYEDLRNDTLSELRKVYDFLGIKINDNELREIVERYDFKNIPSSEKGPDKFNRSATPGAWKDSFSKEEQVLMNSIMAKTLSQMDYQI